MRTVAAKPKPALGFLTVVEDPEHGLFGGFLVLNMMGRPLEFHCTAPLKPNRAQQILYGAALEPYLFGEQIGQTLLARAKAEPLLICTDREPALAVREFITAPVVLVVPETAKLADSSAAISCSAADMPLRRLDEAHSGPRLVTFRVGRNCLAIPALAAEDQEQIIQRLSECADGLDLAEPFQRIRDAIEEARGGGPSA